MPGQGEARGNSGESPGVVPCRAVRLLRSTEAASNRGFKLNSDRRSIGDKIFRWALTCQRRRSHRSTSRSIPEPSLARERARVGIFLLKCCPVMGLNSKLEPHFLGNGVQHKI